MIFIDDLGAPFAWLTPAPIGYVEPGWTDLVGDLLSDIDLALSAHPGATVDLLEVGERGGEMLFDYVVDGLGDPSPAITRAVERARSRARATRCRCGGPSYRARSCSPRCRPNRRFGRP